MFNKSQTYKTRNERKYRRLKADYLVKHRPASEEGEFAVSNLKDVSAGGVRFWTERLYQEGQLLQVSLLVPPIDKALQIFGRAVRVRKGRWNSLYYVGVGFLEIPKADRELLNSFIERLAGIPEAGPIVDHADVVERELAAH